MHLRQIKLIHLLFDIWKNLSTFHVSLILLWSLSIPIFSCFAVLFIKPEGSWITQKTLPARGAAYVCEVSLKSLTLSCFK